MTPYEQLKPIFWPKGERPDVWAILDCARDRRVYQRVAYSGFQRECLFAGALPPALERTAPYLVQLMMDDSATRAIINEGFGNSWGIFLKADLGIKTLRKHLRTNLRVQGPNGKYLLFRYWDPRVLRVYLPTCLPDELQHFFGPLEAIWAEDRTSESRFLRFEKQGSRLVTTHTPIRREDAAVAP